MSENSGTVEFLLFIGYHIQLIREMNNLNRIIVLIEQSLSMFLKMLCQPVDSMKKMSKIFNIPMGKARDGDHR